MQIVHRRPHCPLLTIKEPVHRGLKITRPKEQAEAQGLPGFERRDPNIGATGLRHPLDCDMGRHTAPRFEKEDPGSNGQHRRQCALADAGNLVEQNHGACVRKQILDPIGRKLQLTPPRASTSATLLPPNAKELLSMATRRKSFGRRLPTSARASGGIAGSASPSQRCGGKRPSGLYSGCKVSHRNAASQAAAAPNVWPVIALVELHGVAAPNKAWTAFASMASLSAVPVPCRLT